MERACSVVSLHHQPFGGCRIPEPLDHLAVRAGALDVEDAGSDLPPVLGVERHGGDPGVAPECPDFRILGDHLFRRQEQFLAETAALQAGLRGHAAEAPGQLVFEVLEHEAGTAGQDRLVRRRIVHEGKMPGARPVVAGESGGFPWQACPEDAMAQVEDEIDRDRLDDKFLCGRSGIQCSMHSLDFG